MMKLHFHIMACLAAALLLAAPVFGQTDTLKKRQVNLDLNFLAHGEICGGSQARWGWFSLVVNPRLFSVKW